MTTSAASSDGWTILRGTMHDIDALRDLWLVVHQQHRVVAPELGELADDASSWAQRRAQYEGFFAEDRAVLVVARSPDRGAVGYALARVADVDDTWIADTWVTGRQVGEIESLSVLPPCRGRGLGNALLDELEQALAAEGVHDLVIGVVEGNDAARRLYEGRGYRPTFVYLSRFASRAGS